jgi:hypothetical protein
MEELPEEKPTLLSFYVPRSIHSNSTINPNPLNSRHTAISNYHLPLHHVTPLTHDSHEMDLVRLIPEPAAVVQKLLIQLLELPEVFFDPVEIDKGLLDLWRGVAGSSSASLGGC